MRSDDLALVVCRPVAPGTSPTGRTGCPPVATAVRGGPDHETAAAQVNYLAALAEPPHEAILAKAKAKAKTLDRRITYWNAAAQRLHGHPPQQAIGSHGSLLAPPEREERDRRTAGPTQPRREDRALRDHPGHQHRGTARRGRHSLAHPDLRRPDRFLFFRRSGAYR
ncbi:PAS domain-containing protein [Streptomyces sp. NPDC045470]|uniref:PAS domain-containing protein n=1 Tax=unclassified Streptomyces TaxID=2593676 RepID=UPI0033F40E46